VQLFDDFHKNKVDICRLNYGIISLLPKVKEANRIQQYRPICLLNCLYKLITKVLTIRVEPIADKLINIAQTAFLKGRNILTGIMCLHEIVHETKKRNEVGVILKLDFEKAYDKVNWNILFEYMQMRGFCEQWRKWIAQVVTGGTVSIKVNDKIGSYIKSYKGVRQGDPLSPILFNFAADCLTKMVENAQEKKLFTGLISHIMPNGVAILQYADDTIVFLKHDVEGARNLKLLLYMYEMMAGLKINFNKSEILVINDDSNWGEVYADIFNCQIGTFPIKYLGVPVSPSRLPVRDWSP
jgi:hypothetical protein